MLLYLKNTLIDMLVLNINISLKFLKIDFWNQKIVQLYQLHKSEQEIQKRFFIPKTRKRE